MNIAFCLFKYFPFGGLQTDFLAIAKKCQQRGHNIEVYTRSWQGDIPEGFNINIIKASAFTNIGKDVAYVQRLKRCLPQKSLIVGFNKMPNLDVYFAADSCYAARVKNVSHWKKKVSRRHREKLRLEANLFHLSQTHIMFIAPQQLRDFQKFYSVEQKNLLPPGISSHLMNHHRQKKNKQQFLSELGVNEDTFLILMVGSGFSTKGVDRSLKALRSLPENLRNKTHLAIAGKGKEKAFAIWQNNCKLITKLLFWAHVQMLTNSI